MKRIWYSFYVTVLAILLFRTVSAQVPIQGSGARNSAGNEGVTFTANRGQVIDSRGDRRPDILYTVDSRGASLYFMQSRVSYVFSRIEAIPPEERKKGEGHDYDEDPYRVTGLYRMDMELVGANPKAVVTPEKEASGYSNYYLAHCPDGIVGVPSYGRLVYHNIYPNIDMVISGQREGAKCNFVVHPGGDPDAIRMRYVAAESVEPDASGGIRVATPYGYLEEDSPRSYLGDEGGAGIESRYRIEGSDVGFSVGAYDKSQTLVIDPYRKWATYYGGSSTENLNGGDPSEVDRTGNVLITGYTNSNSFPVSTGAQQTSYGGSSPGGTGDAFVVKFSSSGSRLWSTYYGGSNDELAHGIITDIDRNVFIAGHTLSSNFPTSNAVQSTYGGARDAFVVKFDSAGVRQWATYYGGSNLDDGYGFAADSAGNVAAVITTGSSGLGTSGTFQATKPNAAGNLVGNYDVLIAKFTASGALSWATYYGGSDQEYGYAAASDSAENIIFTGWTYSNNFPTTSGAQQSSRAGSSDAFVVKLSSSGTRQWATYYGGTGTEDDDASTVGYAGIATDGAGNIFITGLTTGGFPTTSGAMQTTYGGGSYDGYAVKFNQSGAMQWSTYIGGSGTDVSAGIASNAVGGVLVTGYTTSTNFPTTTNGYQTSNGGQTDAFITKLSSGGSRVWSTYYGGSNLDYGEGISFDPFGSIIVAGHTQSTNFPTLAPYQNANAGAADAFVILFCDIDPGVVDTTGHTTFCQGDSVILSVQHGYASVLWSTGETSDSITVKQTGNYWVRLTNGAGCQAYSDTTHVLVYPKPVPTITGNLVFCAGDSTTLDAGSGFATYRWSTGATTQKIVARQAGQYSVVVSNAGGCIDSAGPVSVTVNPKPDSIWVTPPGPISFCPGGSITLTANGGTGNYLWSSGERTSSIVVTKSGTYRLTVSNANGCSTTSNIVNVTVYPPPAVQVIPYGPTFLCDGDSLRLGATPGFVKYQWSTGDTTDKIVVKQGNTYTVTVTDSRGCTGTASLAVTVVPKPKPLIGVLGQPTFCQGDSVILDAGAYSLFAWSSGQQTRQIVVRESGRYSVYVQDAYGCWGFSDTVTVVVLPRPSAASLNGPTVVCANSTASYTVKQDSGVIYAWSVSGGGGILLSGDATPSIQVKWGPSGTGTVSVSVTSAATQCAATASLKVTIGNSLVPTITASRPLNLCDGDSVTLDAGGGYSEYHWSNGATSQRITVRDTGTFTVSVKDANGCGGSSLPTVVRRNQPPEPVITAPKHAICPGESLTLDAGSYSHYRWSGGQSNRTITVSQAGVYSVTVTDSSGCVGTSAGFEVTVQTPPMPEISGPNSACLNSVAGYSATPSGSGDTYVWQVSGGGGVIQSGQGTSSIMVGWNGSGTGSVTVVQTSGASGCTGTGTPLLVAVGTTLRPRILTPEGVGFCQGESIRLVASDGFARYEWSTGSTEKEIVVSSAGEYRLQVWDASGCSGGDTVEVVERKLPYPFITPGGPIGLCPGESVVLSAAAGYGSYSWSDGETTREIVVRQAGRYSVTASNEDGCRGKSEEVEVDANSGPGKPEVSASGDTLRSTPATGYQWFYHGEERTGEGVKIAGGVSRSYIADKPGYYSVGIVDEHGCSAQSEPVEAAVAFARIRLGEYDAAPGERLTIPIDLSASHSLDKVGAVDWQLRVRFNRNLLFPVGSTPVGRVEGNDRVLVLDGSRHGGLDSGAIGKLEFTVALGDTLQTPLVIEKFLWKDGKSSITTENGLVRIHPGGGWKLYLGKGRMSLLPVVPNPTNGRTAITYETIENGRTRLYIVDALGQRLATLVDEDRVRGRYELSYDAAGLSAGNYFLVLETSASQLVQPMEVRR